MACNCEITEVSYQKRQVCEKEEVVEHISLWRYQNDINPPHDDVYYLHCGFIQGLKEVNQDPPFLAQLTNHQAEHQTEDDEAQDVDAIIVLTNYCVILCYILSTKMKTHICWLFLCSSVHFDVTNVLCCVTSTINTPFKSTGWFSCQPK